MRTYPLACLALRPVKHLPRMEAKRIDQELVGLSHQWACLVVEDSHSTPPRFLAPRGLRVRVTARAAQLQQEIWNRRVQLLEWPQRQCPLARSSLPRGTRRRPGKLPEDIACSDGMFGVLGKDSFSSSLFWIECQKSFDIGPDFGIWPRHPSPIHVSNLHSTG